MNTAEIIGKVTMTLSLINSINDFDLLVELSKLVVCFILAVSS